MIRSVTDRIFQLRFSQVEDGCSETGSTGSALKENHDEGFSRKDRGDNINAFELERYPGFRSP